jgi:hypothetical protein
MSCQIVNVGKRRDGGSRFWCIAHHANATAKYGVAALECVAAHDPPVLPEEKLDLDLKDYPGGVALWGSVPAVYDTTTLPADQGIHVHARQALNGHKDIDKTFRQLRIPFERDLLSGQWYSVDEIDAINYMVSGVFGFWIMGNRSDTGLRQTGHNNGTSWPVATGRRAHGNHLQHLSLL